MSENALPWLVLLVVILLVPSRLHAEHVAPVSNAVGSLDTAFPVADVRSDSPTNRLPLPSRAAAVTRWNDRALELCVKYRRNPLRVARVLAVLQVAIHDAVAVAVAKEGGEQTQAVAATTAAGVVLDYLFPLETPGRFEAMAWALYAEAAAVPGADRASLDNARQAGQRAAERAIAHALRDHSDLVWDPRERLAPAPGRWRAAPPLYAYDPLEPLAAFWGTWVLKDGGEVQPPPPVVYDTPAYWREAEEVLAVSRALTAEQKRLAEEWNLDRGSVTPAGVWNRKARQLIEAADLDTLRTTEVLAVLNKAMADATVASWRAKFTYWTQRPVTAIRERYDPNWLPFILTPPFPSYVSTHATVSGAAAAVLTAFFPAAAGPLQAAAEEAAMSRLYGGIHFRSDNEAGLELGRRIGRLVLERQ
jgi:hypothetical protein